MWRRKSPPCMRVCRPKRRNMTASFRGCVSVNSKLKSIVQPWLKAGRWAAGKIIIFEENMKSHKRVDTNDSAAPKRVSVPVAKPNGNRALKRAAATDSWNLRLYVAGQTPKSLAAFSNLKRLCEEHLSGRYQIEIVDLTKQPQLAQ